MRRCSVHENVRQPDGSELLVPLAEVPAAPRPKLTPQQEALARKIRDLLDGEERGSR